MGKASIAIVERRASRADGASSRAERASRRVPLSPPRKDSLGFGYLKLVILLAMIFVPWAAIIYVVRLAMTGH
jgi:hypothetical protein